MVDVPAGQILGLLVPGSIQAGDWLGYSVDLDGDVAIVGAPLDDDQGSDAGVAYVYDLTTGFLIHELLPDDGAANDRFGHSVAMHGSLAVVGALYDDDNGASSGSAYLFDTATGQQLDKLVPSDGEANDEFGRAVAIDGSRVLVGSYHDDDNGSQSGSAYEYDTCPSTLTLDVAPGVAVAGDAVSFGAYGGSPGLPVGIAVVAANGQPIWFLFTTGSFDAQCKYDLVTTVPPTAGTWDITFMALGFTASGLQTSNLEVVQFQ